MKQREDAEQERVNALKAARAAIRLRHAINADVECNERLPDIEQQILILQAKDKPWILNASTLTVTEDKGA